MVSRVQSTEGDVVIKFGGGLSTRAPEDEIGDREAAGGQNFLLDVRNAELVNRKPFDLVTTAPNDSSINGGGSFKQSDGTVKAFFQAGNTVYEFDGSSLDASPVLDTVNANAKLRAHWRTHAWTLDDKVIITDLSLNEVIKDWDGTTWADTTFTDQSGAGFGNFFSKYVSVNNDRAVYSNVKTNTATPHLIVGSELEDYDQITVTNRPSSAQATSDPFFITSPDLKPINGHVEAFGTTIFSTESGQLFNLSGSSAQDFSIDTFYAGSAAQGDESLAYIGNDIVYGRAGRVESLRDTERFGDSEADDLTLEIQDQIESYTGWTSVYNSRLNRVYLFPTGQSEVWAFQTGMRGSGVSPWMRWRTQHPLAFQPTFVMSMLDPSDSLEYVFMGDSSGNIFRLEGTGTSGDGGTSNIEVQWLSKLFTAQLDAQVHEIEGWIKYRKSSDAASVTLQLEYAGERVYDQPIIVVIPASTSGVHYSNSKYYNNSEHYGIANIGRLTRQLIRIPGGSNEFQLRVVVEGTGSFNINEVGLRMKAAS